MMDATGGRREGLAVSEKLLHDLRELSQMDNTIFGSFHELENVIQLDIIQLTTVEVENALLQTCLVNGTSAFGIILVENLRNGKFVPRHQCHFSLTIAAINGCRSEIPNL
jgi:hypothetical protein